MLNKKHNAVRFLIMISVGEFTGGIGSVVSILESNLRAALLPSLISKNGGAAWELSYIQEKLKYNNFLIFEDR
ncbi:hypothetical protein FORC066_0348 [Yersinia enterocolitica]|nr:hypothetical protein FORC066_0348 [Yersinia enterocolitica]